MSRPRRFEGMERRERLGVRRMKRGGRGEWEESESEGEGSKKFTFHPSMLNWRASPSCNPLLRVRGDP